MWISFPQHVILIKIQSSITANPQEKNADQKLHIKFKVTFIDAALPDVIKVGHSVEI